MKTRKQRQNEGNMRDMIHRMVDVVGDAYLEDLHYTVQQYAAKSLNEAMEDRKGR